MDEAPDVDPQRLERIRRAVREILEAVGEDPDRPGLRETPDRAARMLVEIFAGVHEEPADELTLTYEEGAEDLVVVRDIPLHSMCEHHLLPFMGRVHIAYLPAGGRLTGLSKLARLVQGYARRPQVQERLTNQIADAVEARLRPRGVAVVIEAEHLCMIMRGARAEGSRAVTMAVRGLYERDPAERTAVLALLGHREPRRG
ncbi:GTP cyclohydrolase I FolE [Geochorda subterranea]|uniref:GTP cyclohydrolase 1 n=1 Tax=Geochorda subterranea TaxID=3109564 RepID=A0ABZ1BQ83_9FIRM|nr:GTP cyclohydrolase I FolE [Limnochorda sp. LNt]WRP14952.1 GTP cyclohydrolase I FolE [Limnochorda sp. LNt]